MNHTLGRFAPNIKLQQTPAYSIIEAAHVVPRAYSQRSRSAHPVQCNAQQSSEGNSWYTPEASSNDDLLDLLRQRQQETETPPGPGAVYLVGTGPGDPGLLTLKAARILHTADVVLYDRLVSEEILQLINPNAVMVYVGKQRSYHTRTQQEIHSLLHIFAEQGAKVVRLKGGDPFIFGRGGEEMEYLQQQGVRVHVVPGITAAAGISAELGIPLTHRGLATSVRFLTGHARDGGQAELDAAVATAVDPYTTLVVYMGLATLPRLSVELISGGLSADTPALAVERGTTLDQRLVHATLGELAQQVEAAELKSPTLIVIGKVVALSPGWKLSEATGQSLICSEKEAQAFEQYRPMWSDSDDGEKNSDEEEFAGGEGWRML